MSKKDDRERVEKGILYRSGRKVSKEEIEKAESAITRLKELEKSVSFDEMRKKLRRPQ